MKILILSNHLNIGGITRYVFLLAKGLVELKNKVWVVGRGELEEEIKNVGAEVINIDLKIKSELSWRIIRAILKLRKYFYKENPEIIHANTRTNSIIAHYLSRIFNIPYITTCHGLYKIRFSRRAFPFLGEYTIAISRNVRQQLLEGLKIEPERIRLIYNGIDLDYFSPQRIEAKKSDFGFKEDDFILGNVSRLDHLKGQEVLILAMPKILERIPKAKLILIGEGKAKISLEKKIKELGLNKSVFLLGALKDVRVALKIMDVFCFLTFYEGFGLALLEAMAMKLPIIASYIPELEFILDKAGILIPPKKPEILAEKVFDLYNNPRKRTELANLAYARAKDFSYRNTVKDTLEIYKLAKQKWLRKKS